MTKEILLKIFNKTNGRCFYCNKPGEEIDHFVSKSKWKEWLLEETPLAGKLDDIENLFLSCKHCNRSKHNSCPEDFVGNSWMAWSRYDRANKRIGLDTGCAEANYGMCTISK